MKIILLSLPLTLLVAASTHASVLYQFTGTYADFATGSPTAAAFTLELPSPLVSDASFLPGPELVCPMGCREIDFLTDFFPGTNTIGYGVDANMGTSYFYFTPDAFDTNGVHNSILVPINVATLTVSGVPEPSTFWLVLSTLAALFSISVYTRCSRRTGCVVGNWPQSPSLRVTPVKARLRQLLGNPSDRDEPQAP